MTKKIITRQIIRALAVALFTTAFAPTGICQQPPSGPEREVRAGNRAASRLPADMLTQLNGSMQQLARKVSPAVVQIEVSGFGFANDGDRNSAAVVMRQHSIGAGVIVDPDGYIMTNAHVIEGAQRIRVVLTPVAPDASPTGAARVLDAKVIGLQRASDLALLKVDADNLPALRFNLDREPQPGELVFAFGSPEGLQNSVTMGVISSVWRQPDPDNPMVYLQTDAPINPGNSGGPLVDINGSVVGLNTFILSSSGGSGGLGFAIPAGIVNFVFQNLKEHGHVDRVEIGAAVQTITPALADGLGLGQNWGLVIADVAPRGPAAAAGLRPGDVVLTMDGRPMLDLHRFAAALFQHPVNEVLKIDALRGSGKMSFNVSAVPLRDRMDQFASIVDPLESHIGPLGILGLDLTDELRSLFPGLRADAGVIVGGRATGFNSVSTGLRVGDLIVSLNRMPIESVDQLKSAVAKLEVGDAAVFWVERQGQFQFLAFEME